MASIRHRFALNFALSLILMLTNAHATDICDKCNCFPYEDENLVISCKGSKNHMPDIDLELIEWPKSEEKAYKAFFNNLSIHLLPKWVNLRVFCDKSIRMITK